MSRVFRFRDGRVEVFLDPDHRALLATLLGEVDRMLDDGGGPAPDDDPLVALTGLRLSPEDLVAADDHPVTSPEDPAVARLLPDGNREDPALSEEFRRLTEHGLRTRKRAALRCAREALGGPGTPVRLDLTEAEALVKGLTDVRLVLADRLGVRTDEDAERLHDEVVSARAPDSPRLAFAGLYDVLTWWQESLIEVLATPPSSGHRGHRRPGSRPE